ncbi:MAG: FtsX-like permease family protein [Bryobacteraceae bacterium]
MFRYFSLSVKNTIRNRRRSILTICSIAASLCLLGVLFAIYNAMFYKEATPGAALRVVVRHRVSLAQAMPYSYEAKIRQVPGVKEISTWDWFGGVYKDQRDQRNFFAKFGVEPPAFLTIRTQMEMPDDQRRAFLAERTACVISKDVAERLNLKVGDRITIQGDIYPVNLELTIRGIFEDPDALNSMYFNRDYLRELLTSTRRDQAGSFAVLVDNPDSVARVSKAVDDMFDNSPQPTKTESEQQFLLTFVSFLGNIKLFLLCICGAVTFTILLVSGNTMAMSVRERIKEVGVLKTLGFTNENILTIILTEAAVIALIGGAIGIILAEGLSVMVGKVGQNFNANLHGLTVTPLVGLICLALALVIGLVSSFIPAWNAARTNILDSLRYSG